MALSINKSKISDTAWGSVDKAALGKKLATAYAAGEVTKAQIRFVYLHVPNEAFGKDGEGKPEFLYSKAKLPVCEVSGNEIMLNRGGVHAAAGALAGARTMPDMSTSEISAAKRKLRGMYRKLKEKPPKSLMESVVTRITQGKPLTETAKGSLEYLLAEINSAFSAQFQEHSPYGGTRCAYFIMDTFADAVIVREAWDVEHELEPDEYYRVVYTHDSTTGEYLFASQDKWETVELAYRPASSSVDKTYPDVSSLNESRGSGPNGRKRFNELLDSAAIEFAESESGTLESKTEGPWRIKAIGLTADVVNGNGRRRRAAVVAEAIRELRGHLHESAGQGRALIVLGVTTGEPDHPRDKGNRRPLLSETVVSWDTVEFDGKHVMLEGNLLGTAKGKDIRAQMQGGIIPGLSQRSYGDSVIVEEAGQKVEEVTWEKITGYDLTPPTLQSDADSSVTMFETKDEEQGDDEMLMTAEDLRKLIAENPTLFDAVISERVKNVTDVQVVQFQDSLRNAVGAKPEDDLFVAVRAAAEAKKKMDEQAAGKLVEDAIITETKDLPYGVERNKLFVEAVRAMEPKTVEEVKKVVTAQRKSYDKLFAGQELQERGFNPNAIVTGRNGSPNLIVESVFEKELGIPEYGRISFQFNESLVRAGYAPRRDLRKPRTVNEQFAAMVLARFDEVNQGRLIHEMKLLQEAGEVVGDLSLPYSVSRAVIPEVMAQLIAVSIFDTGVTDQSPTRLFYEKFVAEDGMLVTVTDESVDPGALDVWVQMDFQRIIPGSVTVDDGSSTTYAEGTDYVIDYANGRLYAMSTGDITASTPVEVDYQYDAIRLGELAPIERGKMQLSTKTLEIRADRLAQEISTEALVFSRSQLGWDAQARTLNALIQQVRRRIDQGMFRLALASSLLQVGNTGGTWSAGSDEIQEFVNYIGVARVLVAKRFYRPTGILMSTTNSDLVANWVGFTQAGSRPDASLNAEGYVGSLKGLPVFHSTEFPDGYALVFNREIVAYRVFQAMIIKGPYPTYDPSSGKLIAADQFYVEEFNGTDSPVPEKASHVIVTS